MELLLVKATEFLKTFMKSCLPAIEKIRDIVSLSFDVLILEKVRIKIDTEMLLDPLLLNQLDALKAVVYNLIGLLL